MPWKEDKVNGSSIPFKSFNKNILETPSPPYTVKQVKYVPPCTCLLMYTWLDTSLALIEDFMLINLQFIFVTLYTTILN